MIAKVIPFFSHSGVNTYRDNYVTYGIRNKKVLPMYREWTVNDFLHLLVKSNRDYDEDRCLIHKEAKRLGLNVLEDNQLFLNEQAQEIRRIGRINAT